MGQGAMVMKGNLHYQKLQHNWNSTIRLFCVISRTLAGWGILPLCRDVVGIFCRPNRRGHSLGKSYHSAEMQSVYSTAQADWARCMIRIDGEREREREREAREIHVVSVSMKMMMRFMSVCVCVCVCMYVCVCVWRRS